MSVDQIVQLIQSAIQFGTVILFGAMGEILTEKSGNLNLGVPGIMHSFLRSLWVSSCPDR